ncbi:MAG: SCO6880 family protein [Solirubrobacteraceae bacterium]
MSGSRYRFGDVTHRGLLGGVRPGQALVVVAGAGWAIVLIDLAPSGAGALAALLGMLAAAATATMPIGGLTVEQWLPVSVAWTIARVSSATRGRQDGEGDGTIVALPVPESSTPARVKRRRQATPPRSLRGVRIVEIPYRGQAIGAVSEHSGRRLTLLLAGRAPGFALADESEQQQRLAVWGEVLKDACRGAVRRIGWVERTAPAQGDGLARWLHEQRDPEIPLQSAVGRSYLELMDSSAQATREHEVILAVQVDTALLRKDVAGRREEALISAAERIAQGLERARVHVDAALTAGGVARALRVAFDPYIHPQLAALRAVGGGDELSEHGAWPAATRASWGHYLTDGAVHATYEIGGWPRADVGPAFLGPLLGASEHVRAVAVVFEPLDPLRSLRQAEYEITREETDRQTRRRYGQVETARQHQTTDAARMREIELASGHAEVRLAGFVTVTASDLDELEAACDEVVTHAGRANLELRRLYGQQADAFTFTLPLCRGLR